MTWLNDISKNEEYWIAGAEDNYPCVIAFEYKRLRQMCQDSKAYGVLLCLKDNFESLLKFETLISCAWAVENLDDKFEEDTIAEITKPQLSFGEWEYLAKTIINDMRKYDKKLPDYIPLKEIIESYGEPNNIVKWRNSRIGHGVMGFEEDDDFRIDIINYIKIYTEILRKIDEKLRLQRLYIVNDDERIDLTGADKVKSIPYDGELWIRVASGDSMDSFRLNPFLKISNNQKIKWGLYFFETYKRVSVFQEYAEGLVDSTRDGYFEKLSRCLIGKNISRNSNASNRYKSFAEYRELDPYISKEEYVYPEHLIKWLKDCVVRYDKGIFLLKMSRGTGKSVFTDKLSSLFEKPLKIDANFDVRTYHLNRIQAAGEEDFYIYIREMWNHTYNGNPYMGIPSIKELIHEVATPAEAFAEYLRCVLNSRRERDYDKKIMMVFDGLDEVVIDRVRDILPDEELISEGIYILYTMRDPANEKLPSSLMEYVDNLNVSEEHTVALESEENVAFLSTYISRYKFKGDDLKKRLIKASSYRILDLALICALYQKDKGIDELEKVESFVNMYFSYIEEQYTENEFSKLKEIIVILAVFGDKEVLTLRKIGDLSSDSEITLRLVGMMKDLNPLLDITRDKEGNRYRIVNEDVANELLLQIPEKNTIIRQFVNMAIAVIEEGEIPELHSGDEVLCAHVTELALMLPEGIAAMGEQRDVLFDVFFGNISEWSVNDSYEREIKVRYLRQVYRVYQEVYGEDGVNTILVKLFLSDLLFAQGNYEEAQKICNDLLEDVKKHSDCPGWMVVRLLNDNTAVYNEQGKAEEAIELYKKYEKYISESEDDGCLCICDKWTNRRSKVYCE